LFPQLKRNLPETLPGDLVEFSGWLLIILVSLSITAFSFHSMAISKK
jgi:hypothetical protein